MQAFFLSGWEIISPIWLDMVRAMPYGRGMKEAKTVKVTEELHAEILRACPEGMKISAFVAKIIRNGLKEKEKKQ